MDNLQLLRGKDFQITKHLKIHQPTLNEIFEFGEQKYFGMVSHLCATPSDMKSILFDMGLDYETTPDFAWFCGALRYIPKEATSILFGDNVDLQILDIVTLNDSDVILCKTIDGKHVDENCICIDGVIYEKMVTCLREMHGFKKNIERAGNSLTKQILIDDDREARKNSIKKEYESVLYKLIVSMVCTSDFPYNYETVWDLPISVFFKSVAQVQKLKNVEYLMQGIYSGNIDTKKLDTDSMKWI